MQNLQIRRFNVSGQACELVGVWAHVVSDRPEGQTLVGPSWVAHKVLFSSVEQNDVEATKAAALHSSAMNSTKADASAAAAAVSASLDDAELKKLLEKCKRQQAEMDKLAEENRQLKVQCASGSERYLSHLGDVLCHLPSSLLLDFQDETVRMRKVPRSDYMTTNSSSLLGRDASSASLPSLLVVIAAIFIGFFLGKFIL